MPRALVRLTIITINTSNKVLSSPKLADITKKTADNEDNITAEHIREIILGDTVTTCTSILTPKYIDDTISKYSALSTGRLLIGIKKARQQLRKNTRRLNPNPNLKMTRWKNSHETRCHQSEKTQQEPERYHSEEFHRRNKQRTAKSTKHTLYNFFKN